MVQRVLADHRVAAHPLCLLQALLLAHNAHPSAAARGAVALRLLYVHACRKIATLETDDPCAAHPCR